jgi:carboxypeptidase D
MNWPPDLAQVTPYLRRSDVAKALNLNPDKNTGWVECSGAVAGKYHARNSKPSVQLLPGVLEAGIPVVLFSGAKDLICNHIGTEDLIHNMKWSGGTGFELSPGVWAPRHAWTFEGESAGIYQEARNLTYVLFYNSSHMVPFDYPRRTRDMLDRFMGVDISRIGGMPADSRIDGIKVPSTSVGAHQNGTAAGAEEEEKLKQARWRAYYRSGEAALVVVIIIASVWGFFVWRDRRRRQASGYRSIYPTDGGGSLGSLAQLRNKPSANWDVEAGDFDGSELDTFHRGNGAAREPEEGGRTQHAVGEESSDEDERDEAKANLLHTSQERNANAAVGGAGKNSLKIPYRDAGSANSSSRP